MRAPATSIRYHPAVGLEAGKQAQLCQHGSGDRMIQENECPPLLFPNRFGQRENPWLQKQGGSATRGYAG